MITKCRILQIIFTCVLFAPLALAQGNPKKLRADGEYTYQSLVSMSMSARRIAFKDLAPEMQDEVWKAHLKHFLEERLDLTDNERSVVLEALGLLDAGIAAVSQDDPA